jgi:hypothetical protein
MADVIIDLGELPHGRQRDARPTTRSPHGARGMLVAPAVLLSLLGGAAHQPAPAGPTIIAARLGDAIFTAHDRMFIVSVDTGRSAGPSDKIINSYALPSGNLLSRTPVSLSGITKVDTVDDVLLVAHQVDNVGAQDTVAYTAGTGRQLWVHPAELIGASPTGRVALLKDNGAVRGPVKWYGVAPGTGYTVWTQDEPNSGTIDLAPGSGDFPARLVSADVSGHVVVSDPETGEVTADSAVPAPAEWRLRGLNIWIADGLVLLGGRAGIVAYDLVDLRERWRSAVDLTQFFVLPVCGEAICLFGRFGGVQLIDPATGARRWVNDQWAVAQRVGSYLVAFANSKSGAEQPLVVLDPADGRERGSFGAWKPAGAARSDGQIIGIREEPGDQRVWYALLDPEAVSVRVLGVATPVSGDCQVASAALICRRLDASVGVWSLSPP